MTMTTTAAELLTKTSDHSLETTQWNTYRYLHVEEGKDSAVMGIREKVPSTYLRTEIAVKKLTMRLTIADWARE